MTTDQAECLAILHWKLTTDLAKATTEGERFRLDMAAWDVEIDLRAAGYQHLIQGQPVSCTRSR